MAARASRATSSRPSRATFRHEDVERLPRGWRVRSKRSGGHVLRIAFPPGPRRRGAGKLVEVLHPKGERNPKCEIAEKARKNPQELLIFGNPDRKRAARERAERIRSARLNPKRETKRRRKNVSETEQAVKLFQSFHGHDPKEVAEKHVSAAVRKDYAALGSLEYVIVRTPIGEHAKFTFAGDGVKLASSPDGKQLYAIGGNQNIERCLSDDSKGKDFIDLGDALEVQYTARKVHGGYEPVEYYHKFGEKTGALPRLMYDKLRKQIFFIGGDYRIDTSQGVSPGIEN